MFLCHSGIDEFPNVTEADLRAVMPEIASAGLPLLVHAELVGDPPVAVPGSAVESQSYARHLASRPREWEHAAIRLMIDLCREFRCHVHIVHLSSADALPAIARARGEGLPLTVETCPHYLTFAAEEVPDGDTRFKCAPPIRERENRERLWQALGEGLIDTIGTDHSPAPPELKHLHTGDVFEHGVASRRSNWRCRPSGRLPASADSHSPTCLAGWPCTPLCSSASPLAKARSPAATMPTLSSLTPTRHSRSTPRGFIIVIEPLLTRAETWLVMLKPLT